MWDWAIGTAILMVVIWNIAPQQIQVIIYKISLVALAACMAYWIDRSMYQRLTDRLDVHIPRDWFGAMRMLSRALVFLGVVLGLTLAV